MRTNFFAHQLTDPDIVQANAILETCVHYGFCTNTCPTYALTRDENESPRGRIDLIRAMLEKGGAPDAKTVHHLDRCLSCLSCMTTCAVKVDYTHLIDHSSEGRRALREKHGVGAWNVSGAFYGPSATAIEPQIARVRDHFGRSSKGRYIAHEDASAIPPLKVAINAFSGIPSRGELGLLKWRPGGGNIWFLPGTPMDGKIANEFQRICRGIYEEHGLDYTVMKVCGPRFARGLHVLTYNREDEEERSRADGCSRKMSEAVAKSGVFVGRAPLDYHDFHMAQVMPAFRDACLAIKRALDPNGVIAPGRYGLS